MRRSWIVAIAALAVAGAVFFLGGSSPADPVVAHRERPVQEPIPVHQRAALPSGADADTPAAVTEARAEQTERDLTAYATSIRDVCGVPTATVCSGDTCVTGLTGQNGWAGLVVNPQITLENMAMQHFGVPADSGPCGDVITSPPRLNWMGRGTVPEGVHHQCFGHGSASPETFQELCDRTVALAE